MLNARFEISNKAVLSKQKLGPGSIKHYDKFWSCSTRGAKLYEWISAFLIIITTTCQLGLTDKAYLRRSHTQRVTGAL